MAAYDFGGGKDSLFSNFTEYRIVSGEADGGNGAGKTASAGNRSGMAASSAGSGSGVTLGTVIFILFCIIGLFLQLKCY